MRGTSAVFLAFLALFAVVSVHSKSIEVFLVTHSHDDVGWQVPWEEYYTSEVRSILNTVIEALKDHPHRKFTQVEVAFFRRWWQEISEETKATTRKILARGQIEFNIGGETMNDESSTTFYEEINQMTSGADFLLQHFNMTPKSNWHIDPFGHSASTASLWSQMGFPSWSLNRIPWYMKEEMKRNKTLEFVWRGSKTLGKQTEIFAHVMDSHYSTPTEMNLPLDGNFDVKDRADKTVAMIKQRNSWYKHNYLLIPFGDDFTHQHAVEDYNNMDKLIDYINARESQYGVKIHYSFLSEYVEAVNKLGLTWDTYEGDFFPYNDSPSAFWSGYFTSRPWKKIFLRQCDAFLTSAENLLLSNAKTMNQNEFNAANDIINNLRLSTSRTTHHDAVSGTETASTSDDYILSLQQTLKGAQDISIQLASRLLKTSKTNNTDSNTIRYAVNNPLGWPRKQFVSIESYSKNAVVKDVNGKEIASQTNPKPSYSKVPAPYRLYFLVNLGGLSTSIFTIQFTNSSKFSPKISNSLSDVESFGNAQVKINFDSNSGKLNSIEKVQEGIRSNVSLDYLQYYSATDFMGQSSGPYIFRPITDSLFIVGSSPSNGKSVSIPLSGSYGKEAVVLSIPSITSGYTDSISSFTHSFSSSSFGATFTRADSNTGWGSNLNVDFLVMDDFPLRKAFPSLNYALGKFTVQNRNEILVNFTSALKKGGKFQQPPVVILSVHSGNPNGKSVVASLTSVSSKFFGVFLDSLNGIWSPSDNIQINWLAVDQTSMDAVGQKYIRSGVASLPANTNGNVYQYEIKYSSGSCPEGIIFTSVLSSQKSAFISNIIKKSSTTFDGVIRRVGNDQTFGDLSIQYLILPRLPIEEQISSKVNSVVIDGPFVKEIQQTYAPNYGQTFVIYNIPGTFGSFVEIVSEVGPLNVQGRELITRMSSDLNSNGVLYTDDNGLEIMTRKFDKTKEELQSGNYFPMVQRSYIRDEGKGVQITLLSDATHGVSSLGNGEMEVMLHRRCLMDDGRGVGQPLNDLTPIRPTLWLTLDSTKEAAKSSRFVSTMQQFPPQMVMIPYSGGSNYNSPVPSLPLNVHLLTLRSFRSGKLLRLQHIYAAGEHATLSRPVKIDLNTLFPGQKVKIVEWNLNVNTPINQLSRMSWKTNGPSPSQTPVPLVGSLLTIQPMEIRTFIVESI